MNEQRYTNRSKWLVLTGAGVFLLLLAAAWISEGTKREWRKVQREYEEIMKVRAEPGSDAFERGIFQVDLPGFNRSDRCISCHQGLEDPFMQQAGQPHSTHPGEFLEDHPVQEYGCTICHGGQPGALSRRDAFGQLPETHWPYPLLEQPYIQASCGRCHLAVFSAAPDSTEGMEVFQEGLEIFGEEGCLGCHQARGLGGIMGPDLTRQGEKTRHEYSFQNIQGEQTVSNWLKEHFRDPEMVSPGSQMLSVSLEEGELEALATFVMGLSRPDIPFEYFSMSTLSEFRGSREALDGEAGYARLCSACHGKHGEGKGYEEFKTGVPAIGNPDFLRVTSIEYIRFTLEKGRSMRQMASWSESVSGLKDAELDGIAEHLMQQGKRASGLVLPLKTGDSSNGARLYGQYCTSCHGEDGKGGVAVALNQEDFLGFASDEYILTTLARGRGNAGMPAWFILEDEHLADLLTYIRSWGRMKEDARSHLPSGADADRGALRYHYLCSRCHGEAGEGETGPAIINRDFLEAADDHFLYQTIARGRGHTAMFGWSSDLYNQERLEKQDITDIIAFMRVSAGEEPDYVFQGSNPGRYTQGAIIFEKYCAACHGLSGEGVKAPALNNQEFLSAASNGYLLATITLGRSGTLMPPWGYGDPEHPMLSGSERQDLVAHIRSFQRIHIKF